MRGLRRAGLGWVPRLVPRGVKRAVPQALTSFGKVAGRIDWSRTRAYCPSAPGSGLWVNLRGREPEGIVAPGAEYERVVAELRERLLAFRDPRTGRAGGRRRAPARGHLPRAARRRADPTCWSRPPRTVCMVEGLGQRVAHAGGPRTRGAHRQPRARRHPARCTARTCAAARRCRWPRSRTSRRRCSTCSACPVDADMDGRVLTEALRPERLAAEPVAVADDAVRAAGERFPLLGGRREAHPGHAGGTRIRMRPRAAVFCLHDIVPDERLAEVAGDAPAVRALARRSSARISMAARARRPASTITAGQVPDRARRRASSASPSTTAAPATTTEAFPALIELGLRATFFVVPTLVGTPGYVTWAQLREMAAAGMEIGSHSLTHPFLHDLDARRPPPRVRRVEAHPRGPARRAGAQRVAAARLGAAATSSRCCDELGYRAFCTSRRRLVASRRPPARDARASRCGAAWQPEDFAAIADGRAARALAPAGGRGREERGQGVPRPRRLAAAARAAAGAPGAADDRRRCHSTARSPSSRGCTSATRWCSGSWRWLRRRPVARRRGRRRRSRSIICAYNEERDIRRKLEETLACDYPADRLEVIVASDGSTDRTDDIVREFAPAACPAAAGRRAGRQDGRAERRRARGHAARSSSSPTSRPSTRPGTIRAMVENFADPARRLRRRRPALREGAAQPLGAGPRALLGLRAPAPHLGEPGPLDHRRGGLRLRHAARALPCRSTPARSATSSSPAA